MKPLALLCLPLLLAGCETTRYPTPEEMFEGQAILSINFGSRNYYEDYPRLSEHLERLQTPVNLKRDLPICQIPTTDAIVEAVNDLVRTGRPLSSKHLYAGEPLIWGMHNWPVGTYLPEIVTALLIDSRGRSVSVGEVASDFDGNYFVTPRFQGEQLDRIANLDDVFKTCVEYAVVFSALPPL